MKTANELLEAVRLLLKGRKHTGSTPAIRRRQHTEEALVLAVAITLLDYGYLLGVNDGEETTIHHSRDINAIQKALFTTDEDYLFVYIKGDNTKDPRPQYWVKAVYGNDGWDVISDYSIRLDDVIGDRSAFAELQQWAEEGII